MEGSATTNVVQTNNNGNSTSPSTIPSERTHIKANSNGQQPSNLSNTSNGSDSAKTGRRPASQNYSNMNNSNANRQQGNTGTPLDTRKNPRRGKRFNVRKTPAPGSGPSGATISPPKQSEETNRGGAQVLSPSNQPLRSPAVTNGKTWSGVVASPYVHNGHQAAAQEAVSGYGNANEAKRYNNRPKKGVKKFEEKPNRPVVEETEFNVDEKIEAIQFVLDQKLNAMQTKADRLKTLQEEIKAIKAERDGKIEELTSERVNLIELRQKLKNELMETENQISNIDATMAQLKMEKIQKIRSLEQQSRSLLEDKVN
jgi:hypothetical protein